MPHAKAELREEDSSEFEFQTGRLDLQSLDSERREKKSFTRWSKTEPDNRGKLQLPDTMPHAKARADATNKAHEAHVPAFVNKRADLGLLPLMGRPINSKIKTVSSHLKGMKLLFFSGDESFEIYEDYGGQDGCVRCLVTIVEDQIAQIIPDSRKEMEKIKEGKPTGTSTLNSNKEAQVYPPGNKKQLSYASEHVLQFQGKGKDWVNGASNILGYNYTHYFQGPKNEA
ncbi:hypothetical protein HAX54_017456 [Datura stramonium]|uniref:Uncharacterized protein n=1 Tax=Datura stramonium TaxID=4076 RepID=A0ABS8ULI2_DATST|nr:hypothetical protein [Datura stramonium]